MVNIVPINPLLASQNNSGSHIEPNSHDIVDEGEDSWYVGELNEFLDSIDAIRETDLKSDNDNNDKYMEDVPIAKENPSQRMGPIA